MKLRRGFVTNSSSSSFFIAVKAGATIKDIENELKQLIPEEKLNEFWDNWKKWASENESKEQIIPEMTVYLKSRSEYGLTIGGYFIGADWWYDTKDLIQNAIEHFEPDGKLVKVARGY